MKYFSLTLVTFCLTVSGCKDDYFGGLIRVSTHDASEATTSHQIQSNNLHDDKRESFFGECDYWKDLYFISFNDVDTAYLKLDRSRVVDTATLPSGSDERVNRRISEVWLNPVKEPGLRYEMVPRYSLVTANNFEQKRLVAYQVTKNNEGSRIDIAYCVGGKAKLGFYVPRTIMDEFELALVNKFKTALNAE